MKIFPNFNFHSIFFPLTKQSKNKCCFIVDAPDWARCCNYCTKLHLNECTVNYDS